MPGTLGFHQATPTHSPATRQPPHPAHLAEGGASATGPGPPARVRVRVQRGCPALEPRPHPLLLSISCASVPQLRCRRPQDWQRTAQWLAEHRARPQGAPAAVLLPIERTVPCCHPPSTGKNPGNSHELETGSGLDWILPARIPIGTLVPGSDVKGGGTYDRWGLLQGQQVTAMHPWK